MSSEEREKVTIRQNAKIPTFGLHKTDYICPTKEKLLTNLKKFTQNLPYNNKNIAEEELSEIFFVPLHRFL